MFLNKLLVPSQLVHIQNLSTKTITKSTSAIFFKPEVQQILLKLTRIDLNKVFRKQKYGQELKPPEYKFLTTEEVKIYQEESYAKAVRKMQIPPVVPPKDDSNLEILSNDKEILGHDVSSYVFTDITYGISDAKRIIVVREPNGILREANSNERHRMNYTYFSRPGCTYKHPEMFEEENLLSLCNRKEYIFILDHACAQFEPEDSLYHAVLNTTLSHVNETGSFEILRSTRHFGSLVFFLVNNKAIDNLLLHNLHCSMLEDAVWLIKLYKLVHPECKWSYIEGKDVQFVQDYIRSESGNKDALTQALEAYADIDASVSVVDGKVGE